MLHGTTLTNSKGSFNSCIFVNSCLDIKSVFIFTGHCLNCSAFRSVIQMLQIVFVTESYDDFIEANRCPDEDKRKLKLKRFIHLLPIHHNETFKHMAEHLNKVASYGNINKVTVHIPFMCRLILLISTDIKYLPCGI